MPLDTFLPDYDVNEVHRISIAAPPGEVLAAVRGLRASEVPVLVALMALRSLPGLLRGPRLSARRPIVDQFLAAGAVVLAERPDELVIGVVGRFWRPGGDIRPVAPEEFGAFAEAGWAKSAINFHAHPIGGGAALLTTETRVLGTDERARRMFRRYWRVIAPGSAAIRRAWLRAIKRRAEATR